MKKFKMLIKNLSNKIMNFINYIFVIKKLNMSGENIKINGRIHISHKANVGFGNNVNINKNAKLYSEGGITIGNNFHCGENLIILTTNHNYQSTKSIPYDEITIKKKVVIKDNVWIGMNVLIVPGVEIGEGVIIGAGSVVTRNFPNCSIIGGNPAKLIKYRNINYYKDLKNKKNFF